MLSTSAAASSQFTEGATVLTPGAVGGQPTADAEYIQPGQQAHSQGHTQTLYPLSVESLRSSSIAHQVSIVHNNYRNYYTFMYCVFIYHL